MSLNFDLRKIPESVRTDPRDPTKMNPVTEAIIWSSLSIDMGSITEKNIDEWMIRLALSDKLFGTMLHKNREPRPITREEIAAHVGLTTNVSTRTRSNFVKRVTESFFKDAEYYLRRAKEESATPAAEPVTA